MLEPAGVVAALATLDERCVEPLGRMKRRAFGERGDASYAERSGAGGARSSAQSGGSFLKRGERPVAGLLGRCEGAPTTQVGIGGGKCPAQPR